jgi:hypothetical protein
MGSSDGSSTGLLAEAFFDLPKTFLSLDHAQLKCRKAAFGFEAGDAADRGGFGCLDATEPQVGSLALSVEFGGQFGFETFQPFFNGRDYTFDNAVFNSRLGFREVFERNRAVVSVSLFHVSSAASRGKRCAPATEFTPGCVPRVARNFGSRPKRGLIEEARQRLGDERG